MAEHPDNLIVRYLRRLDEKVDRVIEDLREIKQRLSSVEVSVAHVHGDFAAQSQRIDKSESRLDRIEQRLDLRDAWRRERVKLRTIRRARHRPSPRSIAFGARRVLD